MSDSDEQAIGAYRRRRVREQLVATGADALLLFDPVNLRYATGTRNMQVWTMHNFCRYALITADGHTVMFEIGSALHLSDGAPAVDEVRPSLGADYMAVGSRVDELAGRWAQEIADLVRSRGTSDLRVAVDRLDVPTSEALRRQGLALIDAKPLMEHARAIKCAEEILAFRASLATCDNAVAILRDRVQPGMRESEVLAMLLAESVKQGGEYPETRLLTSGPRTNPWFQETSDRVIQPGDLLSFDTDLIGPMGYYNDISRSWVVGEARPSDEQRRLYEVARSQLEHNIALLQPGVGFLEYAERAYVLPDEYLANRYADMAHGCGLGVEYPFIWYPDDAAFGAYDGVFEEDMIVCVESYVGAAGGAQGVKLEQPVWVSAAGPQILSTSPLEDDYA